MDVPRNRSPRRRLVIRLLVGGTAVAALGLITLGVYRLEPADPVVERSTIVIDTVQRGSMLRQVRGYGKLVPEEMHWIPASTDGRIEAILVRQGTTVQPDTILIEMSNAELERDVVTAQMEVRAAEADYTSLRVRLDKEILDQKAILATVQANHSQAALQAELHGQLAKDGLISTLALKVSESQAEELTTRFEIEKERLEINNEAVVAQLAAQQARVDQHKAMARLKQAQLDSLRVRAGTRGVLALLPVEVGQQVAPGANLARVANPERLKAEIKIPETQAKDVQIGQLAAVDTHNGIIAGRVARMDATVLEGSVTVDVVLEEALPKGARPELSVDGTIELERLEHVLHVARPAFGQGNSQVSLFRLLEQGRRAARVRVQFGRTSVNLVEILEGLNEGDQVIVSDMSAWDSFEQLRID